MQHNDFDDGYELTTVADEQTFDATDFGFQIDEDMDELSVGNKKPSTTTIKTLELKQCEELGIGDFNDLFIQLRDDKDIQEVLKEKGHLNFQDGDQIQFDLNYFILEKEVFFHLQIPEKRRLVFFNLIKDADHKDNEPGLTSLSTLLNGIVLGDKAKKDGFAEYNKAIEFLKREKAANSIFIFPIRQCRGFLSNSNPLTGLPFDKAKAAHIVLGIYDSTFNMFGIHDSIGGFQWTNPFTKSVTIFSIPSFFYPEKGAEVGGIRYAGTVAYKIQLDPHLCGYFVDNWLKLIAKTPYLNSFQHLRVDPSVIQSKKYYLANCQKISEAIIAQTVARKKEAELFVQQKQATSAVKR